LEKAILGEIFRCDTNAIFHDFTLDSLDYTKPKKKQQQKKYRQREKILWDACSTLATQRLRFWSVFSLIHGDMLGGLERTKAIYF